MNETLETALQWRDRGVCPIPVQSGSKVAATKWKPWQDRLPPAKLVEMWFRRLRNIGLICGGPGDLCVLDFDTMPAYVRWRLRHRDLRKTFRVRTPRGAHVYLQVDDLPRRTLALDGVDVKCSGYVVTSPSVHPSGKVYRVMDASAEIIRVPDLTEALDGIAMADHQLCEATYEGMSAEQCDVTPLIRGPQDQPVHLYRGVAEDIKQLLPILDLAQRYTTMLVSDGGCGRWWRGRCPNPQHPDHNPSFRVDAVHNQAACLTPSCRLHEPRGMDVIELYRRLHRLSNRGAMAALGLELGKVEPCVR